MKRSKNPAIGTCPCPFAGCTETCSVHRFAHTAVRDTGSRFAGKLYLICPAHGQLGLDARKPIQDYILGHAKLDSPKDAAAEPTSAPPAPPAQPPRAPDPPKPPPAAAAPRTSAPAPAPKRSGWGTVLDE